MLYVFVSGSGHVRARRAARRFNSTSSSRERFPPCPGTGREQTGKMLNFIERYRTRLSQLLAVFYILAFMFSEKGLETAHPAVPGIMVLAGCALVGAATVGRLWCAFYIAGYKTNRLITFGPYSCCRHPLYFFSLLGGIGVGLCTECATLAAVVAAVFAVIYPVTIRVEEKRLTGIYGDTYTSYMASVPRFIPNVRLLREPEEYLANARVFRREVCDALLFAATVGVFEMVEQFQQIGLIKTYFVLY